MTEEEWLKTSSFQKMFEGYPGRMSVRKSRLFVCECCQRVEQLLQDSRMKEYLKKAECVVEDDTKALRQREINTDAYFEYVLSDQCPYSVRGIISILFNVTFRHWAPVDGYSAAILTQAALSPHSNTQSRQEARVQKKILRDIFGNPFRPIVADPEWLTPTAIAIATAIYADRAFDRMPILADALEEAGCTNADVLLHCRGAGPHVRGCWVVDLLLGKE